MGEVAPISPPFGKGGPGGISSYESAPPHFAHQLSASEPWHKIRFPSVYPHNRIEPDGTVLGQTLIGKNHVAESPIQNPPESRKADSLESSGLVPSAETDQGNAPDGAPGSRPSENATASRPPGRFLQPLAIVGVCLAFIGVSLAFGWMNQRRLDGALTRLAVSRGEAMVADIAADAAARFARITAAESGFGDGAGRSDSGGAYGFRSRLMVELSERAGRMAGLIQTRFGFETIAMSSHTRHVALSRAVLGRMKQGVSVGIAAVGWLLARTLYGRETELPQKMASSMGYAHRMLSNKYYVDEMYSAVIIRPIRKMAELLWYYVDVIVIDGVVNLSGMLMQCFGRVIALVQNGAVKVYALSMLVGILILFWVFLG